MVQLENVSDEFMEWLDTCPVKWFLVGQDSESVDYSFTKQVE
jgi:hypothetical protein